LSTIQFHLSFKGHKSLEYCCLVIHLTSVNTISYAELNGGIFFLIAPLGITNTRTNVLRVICQQYVLRAICQQYNSTIHTASNLSTIQYRFIFKGHKSLEYCCLVIDLTSVSTISYAEWYFYPYCTIMHYKYNIIFHTTVFMFPQLTSRDCCWTNFILI
jgi:hypothetical protein